MPKSFTLVQGLFLVKSTSDFLFLVDTRSKTPRFTTNRTENSGAVETEPNPGEDSEGVTKNPVDITDRAEFSRTFNKNFPVNHEFHLDQDETTRFSGSCQTTSSLMALLSLNMIFIVLE